MNNRGSEGSVEHPGDRLAGASCRDGVRAGNRDCHNARMAVKFGEIGDYRDGATFASRDEVRKAGLHLHNQRGIMNDRAGL